MSSGLEASVFISVTFVHLKVAMYFFHSFIHQIPNELKQWGFNIIKKKDNGFFSAFNMDLGEPQRSHE